MLKFCWTFTSRPEMQSIIYQSWHSASTIVQVNTFSCDELIKLIELIFLFWLKKLLYHLVCKTILSMRRQLSNRIIFLLVQMSIILKNNSVFGVKILAFAYVSTDERFEAPACCLRWHCILAINRTGKNLLHQNYQNAEKAPLVIFVPNKWRKMVKQNHVRFKIACFNHLSNSWESRRLNKHRVIENIVDFKPNFHFFAVRITNCCNTKRPAITGQFFAFQLWWECLLEEWNHLIRILHQIFHL